MSLMNQLEGKNGLVRKLGVAVATAALRETEQVCDISFHPLRQHQVVSEVVVDERHLRERTMERYIRKGRGGIFENAQSKHGMSPLALARMAAQSYPDFFKPWQTRIADLPEAALVDLLRRVPDARISAAGREFALSLLAASRKMILEAP